MTNKIHPTAIIDSAARIGDNVQIGPYCVIGGGVTIGDGTIIGSHVVIDGITTIGKNNSIFPFAAIGQVPQDLKYRLLIFLTLSSSCRNESQPLYPLKL